MMTAYGIDLEFTDGKSYVDGDEASQILNGYVEDIFSRSPYSFEVPENIHTDTIVEYEKDPQVKPGDEFKVKVTFKNNRFVPHHIEVNVALSEGWSAEYNKTVYVPQNTVENSQFGTGIGHWEMTITVGDNVGLINRIPIIFSSSSVAVPVMIPIVLLG